MFSSVVLPAPLGPITDTISPRGMSKLTRLTAWTPPNAFDTSRTSSSELMGGRQLARGWRRVARHVSFAYPAHGRGWESGEHPSAQRSWSRSPLPPPRQPPSSTLREPSLAAAIVLHVAVALALPHPGQAQIEFLDILVLADHCRHAIQHDATALHNVAI